jgi:transcriptional regulator with XRE-family HTH domain
MTLREVEDATGKEVSNAYLSQLEHGRIAKPAPNVLHSLAQVYGVPYDVLMERAGYLRRDSGKGGRLPTFAIEDLTPEEEEALLDYLAYLRFRKRKR